MVDPEPAPAMLPGAPPPPGGERGRRLDHQLNPARPNDHGRDPFDHARYATVVVPDGDTAKTLADAALVEVLQAHTPAQPWWLGYLDTGVADLVAADAPKVAVYVGWPYVLLEGGPEHALNARRNPAVTPWHSALPELVFPSDRSWLVSTLWDDDWRCVGGPAALVDALLLRPNLQVRAVSLDEDATPPAMQAGDASSAGPSQWRSATGTPCPTRWRPREAPRLTFGFRDLCRRRVAAQ